MKLILTASVENLGVAGDVVEVKDGYGRNFLLPRGFAMVATRGAEKQVEGIKRARDARAVRDLDHANELKQSIEGLSAVPLTVRSGSGGKLFGSVSASDVAGALKAAGGPAVDKRSVVLPKAHIKSTGDYAVVVNLHPSVSAKFNLSVTAS